MPKILYVFLIIFVILIVAIIGIRFFSGDEDTWLCQNNQWIKHGNPSQPMPEESCGEDISQGIIVNSPTANEVVQNPINLEGLATGRWYFEATFPVKLVSVSGAVLNFGYVQATSDWMTENYVPFKGQLTYQVAATTTATLVFERDNPSGLISESDKYEVPIILSPVETQIIKVYFNNDNLDPEFSCNKVFPVERKITKTQTVARVALEELLKGATQSEKDQGYFTSINSGVVIQSLTIDPPTGGGIARVDFDEQLEYQVGGSCRVAAIHAQIVETLLQFPTVQEVIVSINGRTEDILQP